MLSLKWDYVEIAMRSKSISLTLIEIGTPLVETSLVENAWDELTCNHNDH